MNTNAWLPDEGIMSAIGSTPLVRLTRLLPGASFRIYAKLELMNPGGSSKDRPAMYMIRRALEEGKIGPNTVLIESSSGNLGISLAQICSRLGIAFICVVDPKTTAQNLRIMRAYGARVVCVEHPDPESGEYLTARLRKVSELQAQLDDCLWLNQYANEHNAGAHYQFTMREIAEQLDRIDYLFCAISSCGTIRGCADYIHDHGFNTKIVAVDAAGSLITGESGGRRLIPGFGAGIRPRHYQPHQIDEVVRVNDWGAYDGCMKLLEREAILAGGSSGAVVTALESYQSRIRSDEVAVILLPDRGERYLDTIYNEEWVRTQLDSGEHGEGAPGVV